MKVKTILVSQTKPTIPHSPFFELEKSIFNIVKGI